MSHSSSLMNGCFSGKNMSVGAGWVVVVGAGVVLVDMVLVVVVVALGVVGVVLVVG